MKEGMGERKPPPPACPIPDAVPLATDVAACAAPKHHPPPHETIARDCVACKCEISVKRHKFNWSTIHSSIQE